MCVGHTFTHWQQYGRRLLMGIKDEVLLHHLDLAYSKYHETRSRIFTLFVLSPTYANVL